MPQASIQVRVPFHDVDSSGRIHFTAMFRYMELAEHELMRSIGFPYAAALQDTGFPRVHVSCDFRRAIQYDDELTVYARVERVSRTSWIVAFAAYFTQEIREGKPENVGAAAEGQMTIVAINAETQRATSLPEDLRRALAAA